MKIKLLILNASRILICSWGFLPFPGYGAVYSNELALSSSLSGSFHEDSSDSVHFWGFDRWNDREGWTCPEILNGSVTGGALWLSVQLVKKNEGERSWKEQVWGDSHNEQLVSPKGLEINAEQFNKIAIRLRNLSPETDGFVRWRTTDKPDVDAGCIRFTMKPDCKDWQEVVCHMDEHWKGKIDQIMIQPAILWQRGDIWIDWISIKKGDIKKEIQHPDICSDAVVPQIKIPGISQNDFNDAFKVLDECIITNFPIYGFNYPVMSPGGYYGENWWQLDASLNVAGTKWTNQGFVEDMMRGFAGVQAQNPDGRIDLYGGSPVRGQVADVSSLPKYFEAAYDVARRSTDPVLQNTIYETMNKYLGYWFSSKKRDQSTGLITGVFEETFSNPHQNPGIIAPIDLNVAVAVGCFNTGKLGEYLGRKEESEKFQNDFEQLKENINKYLWSDSDQVYYNYNVLEKKHDKRLLCTTFDVLQLGIAPLDRIEKLIPKLLNPSLFYWGIRPLTTIARTEAGYMEATGPYDGKAWFGDIWTLRNLPVIKGLEDAGKHDLAAELTWSTIKTFNAKYCEYITPAQGTGEGVQRYGWSASQYIQTIIEHLFGIDYNSLDKRLRIIPHIPRELIGQELEISNLIIPTANRLRISLKVRKPDKGETAVSLKIIGNPGDDELELFLPVPESKMITAKDSKGKELRLLKVKDESNGLTGVRIKMKGHLDVNFNSHGYQDVN